MNLVALEKWRHVRRIPEHTVGFTGCFDVRPRAQPGEQQITGFLEIGATVAASFSPARDMALGDLDDDNSWCVAGDLGTFTCGNSEQHCGGIDAGFDRCGHRNLVFGNIAKERAKEIVSGFKVVPAAGGLKEHAGRQGLKLGRAGGCGWKSFGGRHRET